MGDIERIDSVILHNRRNQSKDSKGSQEEKLVQGISVLPGITSRILGFMWMTIFKISIVVY